MVYPREIYKPGEYRVVFGPEEHKAAIAEGWTDDRPQAIGTESSDSPEPIKRRGRPPRVQSITEVA